MALVRLRIIQVKINKVQQHRSQAGNHGSNHLHQKLKKFKLDRLDRQSQSGS